MATAQCSGCWGARGRCRLHAAAAAAWPQEGGTDTNKAATDDGATPLHIAALNGHNVAVHRLLPVELNIFPPPYMYWKRTEAVSALLWPDPACTP